MSSNSRACSSRASGVAADGASGMRTYCQPAPTGSGRPTGPDRYGKLDFGGMPCHGTLFSMKRNRFVSCRLTRSSAQMSPQAETATARPRVEGVREAEILEAALEVLAEVGYDRFTMDAVALRAKASKATLYRRWNGKVQLVIDALHHDHQQHHYTE